jgi:O-antigen/teichoic acid export membrane protein
MRFNRSFKNYLSSLAFAATTMATSLVATPWLTAWVGDASLGAFRAAGDWVMQLQLLELGLGGAMFPLFAQALGRGDESGVRAAFVAGFQAYLGVGLLMIAAGLALTATIPWLVTGLPREAWTDLRLGVFVGVLGLICVPFSTFRFLVDAAQRSYVTNLTLLVQSLLVTGLALAFARSGLGITGQFLAVTAGSVLVAGVMARSALRLRPGLVSLRALLMPSWRHNPAVWRTLWSFSLPALLLTICGRLSLTIDNIIVGYFLGSRLLWPFVLTQRLALTVQMQLQSIGNATVAAMAELHTIGHREIFNDRLVELTKLVGILSLAAMIPIAAYDRRFIELWMGPQFYASDAVNILAAANGVTLAILSMWGLVFQATGRLGHTLPINLTSTAINLLVSLEGTRRLGPYGPLLGTFVARLVSLPWVPLLLRRDFGLPRRRLAGALAGPLALGLPYAAILWQVAQLDPIRGGTAWAWLALAAEVAGSSLLFLAMAWVLVYDAAERTFWLDRLRSLRRSRPPAIEPEA